MIQVILEVAIPSIVTIIGFWINFEMIQKEKKLDAYNYKNEEQIKELINIPRKILLYIENYMLLIENESIDKKEFDKVKDSIFDTILCYGSDDAVKILVYYEKILYQGIDDGSVISSVQIIAPLVLLLMQVKYDITNIKTSPRVWYVKFSSQKMQEDGFYEKSVNEINNIVEYLKLSDFLKIDNA